MATSAKNNLTFAPPPSSFSVCAYEGGEEVLGRVADEWRGLCARAADDHPFYRPEWIQAHVRAFIRNARVLLIAVRLDGSLRMILPLVAENGLIGGVPVRKLRAPVNAHGGRFDAVRCPGPEGDAAIQAAWQFLKKQDGWDLLHFRDTLEGSAVGQMAAAASADGFPTIHVPERPSPYVMVPTDPELMNRMPPNSKLRSQLRQARRRLAQLGSLNFHRVETADREALQRFYRLEAKGWKGQEGSAILCNAATRAFYDEMAESAARFGYFSLYMLELQGQLIAAHYAFTHRGRCYSPKVAYDEAFSQFAPGHLIVEDLLRDCAARGIREYDITGSDEVWKMKWTANVHHIYHHYVFKGMVGGLAHTIRFRLRPVLRRVVSKQRG